MATVNEKLFDANVRHKIGLTRLASGNAADLVERLNSFDPKIIRILQGINGNTSGRQLNAALKEIRKINQAAFASIEKDLTKAMQDLAVHEVTYQHNLLKKTLPKEALKQITPKKVAQAAAKAVVTEAPLNGALLPEYVAGMELGRYNRMRDMIRREVVAGGAEAGIVTDAILSGIVGSKEANYEDGLLGLSRRSIEQNTRTISTGIANVARAEYTTQNDDIFDGEMWVSVLDMKTSDICQSLDGTVFPVGEGPTPPAHPNCRSERVPIVKDWEAMGLSDLGPGTRESMNGEVPETITYNEWLKGQPASVQDEVLGPTRAEIFRKGDITLDRFIDDQGRRWTLAELEDQGILQ